MADSHGAHEVNNTREATPPANPGNELEGSSHASPAPRLNQMRDHEEELEEAMRQLEKEYTEVKRQLGHRGESGRAREVNRQIPDDHVNLPNFTRASSGARCATRARGARGAPRTRQAPQ